MNEYKLIGQLFDRATGKIRDGGRGSSDNGYGLELKRIFDEYHQVRGEMEVLVDLAGKRRQWRGWIDAGGMLLKTVFGTLDAEDPHRINEKIIRIEG